MDYFVEEKESFGDFVRTLSDFGTKMRDICRNEKYFSERLPYYLSTDQGSTRSIKENETMQWYLYLSRTFTYYIPRVFHVFCSHSLKVLNPIK